MPNNESFNNLKNWWQDIEKISQVSREVALELIQNISRRLNLTSDEVQTQIMQQLESRGATVSKRKVRFGQEVVRTTDTAHGKGSLSFKSSARGREVASENAGQRKRTTFFADDGALLKQTDYYQKFGRGDETKIRETVYRAKNDREKSGSIVIREKDRVSKKYTNGTERVIYREDGKLISETFSTNSDGERISSGKIQIYPKEIEKSSQKQVEITDLVESSEVVIQKISQELKIQASETYSRLWTISSENKVQRLLSSTEFKNKEQELYLKIQELLPLVLNKAELEVAGFTPEEISTILKSYTEGIMFGLMMGTAPENDSKMGPFIDLLRSQLSTYEGFLVQNGILKPSVRSERKSSSIKRTEAIESTSEIADRFVRFHQIINNFNSKYVLDRFVNLTDSGLPTEPVTEAVILKSSEEETIESYLKNRIDEVLSFNFPGLSLNISFVSRVKENIFNEFKKDIRYRYLVKKGLDKKIPSEILSIDDVTTKFDEFLLTLDLKKLLDPNFTTVEINSLATLKKFLKASNRLFTDKFGFENAQYFNEFTDSLIDRFLLEKGLDKTNWPLILNENLFNEIFDYLLKIQNKELIEFIKVREQARKSPTKDEVSLPQQKNENNEGSNKYEEIRTFVSRSISSLPKNLKDLFYSERHVDKFINYILNNLPQEIVTSFFQGNQTKLEDFQSLIEDKIKDISKSLTEAGLRNIIGNPTLFESLQRVKHLINKRKVEIISALGILIALSQPNIREAVTDITDEVSSKINPEEYIDNENLLNIDKLVSLIEDEINEIDLTKNLNQAADISTNKILSIFSNYSGIEKNERLSNILSFEIQSLISQSTGIDSRELAVKITQRISDIYYRLSNLGPIEMVSLAGIKLGSEISTNQLPVPTVPAPVLDRLESGSKPREKFQIEGVEVIEDEIRSLTNSVILVPTDKIPDSKTSKIRISGRDFNITENHILRNEKGRAIGHEEIVQISSGLNTNSLVFVVGNREEGFNFMVSDSRDADEWDLYILNSQPVIKIEDYAPSVPEGDTYIDSEIREWLRVIFNKNPGGFSKYNPELKILDTSNLDEAYKRTISNSIGNSEEITVVYQSGYGTCAISTRTTVIGDLIGQKINTYELGNYITSFYQDEVSYRGTFGDLDFIKLVTDEEIRNEFLILIQKIKELELVRSKEVSSEKIEDLNLEIEVLEKEKNAIKENYAKENKSIMYFQGVILDEIRAESSGASALTALGIEVERSDLFTNLNSRYPDIKSPNGAFASNFRTSENKPSQVILDNLEPVVDEILSIIDNNTSTDSRVVIDMFVGYNYIWEGDKISEEQKREGQESDLFQSRHSASVIGVNKEEKYILIKDTNAQMNGYFFSDSKDETGGRLPTIEKVASGIYKISFNTDDYSKEDVATTISSLYNIYIFKKK